MTLRKLALCMVLILGVVFTTGFTDAMRNVSIEVDGKTLEVSTRYSSPELILHQAGVEIRHKDEFQLKKSDKEEKIIVQRAVPVVIEFEGDRQKVYTTRSNVGEVLRDYGYVGDRFSAELDGATRLEKNLNIKIHDLVAEKEREEAARRAQSVETSRGAMRYVREYDMEATAYLPTDGDGNGITASGMLAERGVVAVDTDVIPLGTRLYIPGYGMAIAGDTGGAIYGERIDLCMESYGEAMEFGRRWVKVYVLE